MNLIENYKSDDLPDWNTTRSSLYQYIWAGNGIFIRAVRPEMGVLLKLHNIQTNGLPAIEEECYIPTISIAQQRWIIENARWHAPREALFYAGMALDIRELEIVMPEQAQTDHSVVPIDTSSSVVQNAFMEIHTHGDGDAFFSTSDDKDESFGFRVYVVIGHISDQQPTIKARVGIYGQFIDIHPCLVTNVHSLFKEDVWKSIPKFFKLENS